MHKALSLYINLKSIPRKVRAVFTGFMPRALIDHLLLGHTAWCDGWAEIPFDQTKVIVPRYGGAVYDV